MLAALPKFLQHEVAMYLNKDIVASTALFRGCSATLVASIVEHLHAHRCLPLDMVINKGDVADELYLIKRGLFEVLNDDGTVHRMLGAGSYFGEVALLCDSHRTMTVRAVTMGLIFVIERSNFVRLMMEYPADRSQLILSAALRYRTRAKPGYIVQSGADRSSTLASTLSSLGPSLFTGTHTKRGSWTMNQSMPHFQQGLSRELAIPTQRTSERLSGRLSVAAETTGGKSWMQRFGLRQTSAGGAAETSVTKPLAYLPSTSEDIETLKFHRCLVPISSSQSEVHSRAMDAEVVAQLRCKSREQPKKVGITDMLSPSNRDGTTTHSCGSSSATGGEGPASLSSNNLHRRQRAKSVYDINREKLEDAVSIQQLPSRCPPCRTPLT